LGNSPKVHSLRAETLTVPPKFQATELTTASFPLWSRNDSLSGPYFALEPLCR